MSPDREIAHGDTSASPTGDKNGPALDISLLPFSPATAISPLDSAEVEPESVLNPTASIFQPALIATATAQSSAKDQESERFLDRLQALVETMQMPIIPKGDRRENPHVMKWREGQVTIYTERMVNYYKLSPEDKADTVAWVDDWAKYFETHELVR